ncbi:MAG TPA: helix-turn-helix domain-containing protein [Pyrinomonadaceae bacterium]|nr:helix-turn-helix domain-containing protein [Pyrinomonadaceae bacterium]
MNKRNFEKLMGAANEALEHAQGKRQDLRTTTLVRQSLAMDKNDVIQIRKHLNMSQAVFAHKLNISIKTVQSWEQGLGKPSGAALKLLSIVKKNPKVLAEQ